MRLTGEDGNAFAIMGRVCKTLRRSGEKKSAKAAIHIRTDHAPANFTTIKHMAQNLIRKAPGKDSLRLRRKAVK